MSLYGIMETGLVLLLLATDHQAMRDNYNLLWLNPLHLLTALLLLRAQKRLFTKLYLLASGFLYLTLLLFWEVVPQEMHPATIPLIILISFRYFYTHTTIELPYLQKQYPKAKKCKIRK